MLLPKRAALAVTALLAASLVAVAPAARAEGLSPGEASALGHGQSVVREQTVNVEGRRYVGGLTYTVVDATAGELSSVFEDVEAYRRVLPRTKHAKLVGRQGDDMLVELAQGNALVEAEYTIRVRRMPSSATAREFRFWLEPTRPHGIDDAWGFFRLQPFVSDNGTPRVLLTYGVLVDVGPGIVRDFFEDQLRAAVLSVPQLVRRYVAQVRRGY